MTAYYNEHDPFAAALLRELIAAGHIAPGTVDERDIRDVKPNELVGYTQCHFFAGIGGFSRALRLAGWRDDRPAWTGSCPCQPFSAAGKRGGFADERHLWPYWHWLIQQSRPDVVFGEQVASRDGLGWLNLVSADLEGTGYTVGAVDLCAAGLTVAGHPLVERALERLAAKRRRHLLAGDHERASEVEGAISDLRGIGFGTPHIRQRLWFVAVATGKRWDGGFDSARAARRRSAQDGGPTGGVGDGQGGGFGIDGRAPGNSGYADQSGKAGGVDNPDRIGTQRPGRAEQVTDAGRPLGGVEHAQGRGEAATQQPGLGRSIEQPSKPGGFWAGAEWLPCTDGKARPVERIPEQMADGLPGDLGLVRVESGYIFAPLIQKGKARVGRLRGYGNAIVPQVAAEFIRAFAEQTLSERR